MGRKEVLIEYKRVDHFRGVEKYFSSFVQRKPESSAMSPSRTSPALPTAAGPENDRQEPGSQGRSHMFRLIIHRREGRGRNQPSSRQEITVSCDAQVAANITAHDVVVLGKVSGNVPW